MKKEGDFFIPANRFIASFLAQFTPGRFRGKHFICISFVIFSITNAYLKKVEQVPVNFHFWPNTETCKNYNLIKKAVLFRNIAKCR